MISRQRWPGFILAICLLVTALTASASGRLEIYELKQRTAEEVIPIIRPMISPASAVNGQGYRLLVRGDEQTHVLVRQVLAQIDTAPRNLLISVSFTRPASTNNSRSGARIDIQDGDVEVHAGRTPRGGGSIEHRSDSGRVKIAGQQDTTLSNDDSQYQLRVLEGNTAFIHTGSAVPYSTTTIYPGGLTQRSTEYVQTRSGFVVRPRLNNDTVLLDVLPSRENFNRHGSGAIDTTRIQTTLSGRVGEWIELGNIATRTHSENSATLYSSRQENNLSEHVFIKVELAK